LLLCFPEIVPTSTLFADIRLPIVPDFTGPAKNQCGGRPGFGKFNPCAWTDRSYFVALTPPLACV
jgi:hypothetical protein